jgi:predicted O-methyltransferase YrrM
MQASDLLVPMRYAGRFCSGGAMSFAGCYAMAELLAELRPRSILEIGPGRSSLILLNYARQCGALYRGLNARGEHHEFFRQVASDAGFDPSRASACDPRDGWYDLAQASELIGPEPYELIVVDGPWEVRMRAVRAARVLLRAAAASGTAWIIDDAENDGPESVIRCVREWFGPFAQERHVRDDLNPLRTTALWIPRGVGVDLPQASVAIITWARTEARLEYLRRTLDSLYDNLRLAGKRVPIVVSAERDGAARSGLEPLCLRYGARLVWNPRRAGPGCNLDHALSHTDAPFVLALQDDWVLAERLDLADGLRFLARRTKEDFHLVRYAWGMDDTIAHPLEGRFLRLAPESTHLYSDQPHLRSAALSHIVGPYDAVEPGDLSWEWRYNNRIKALAAAGRLQVAAHWSNSFQHIGEESVLER